MASGGFEFLDVVVIRLIMSLIVGLILYGIVRFGVKHGMRSYHAETAPRPTDGPAGAQSGRCGSALVGLVAPA